MFFKTVRRDAAPRLPASAAPRSGWWDWWSTDDVDGGAPLDGASGVVREPGPRGSRSAQCAAPCRIQSRRSLQHLVASHGAAAEDALQATIVGRSRRWEVKVMRDAQ